MSLITDYHAKLIASELTRQCPSDSVQKLTAVLSDAQVDLNPYQVGAAALFAFSTPLTYGAILADEVGFGKTIEAGLLTRITHQQPRKTATLASTPNRQIALRTCIFDRLGSKTSRICRTILVELSSFCRYTTNNTLAAPLPPWGDVHQGRVFYCALGNHATSECSSALHGSARRSSRPDLQVRGRP
ncbi:RNA polymerase-associated protein RapA [Adhaeretor mobilis]|uniref:RNA polymerase-associated protein RapA n=1 Tax=Adhaeretor mobilis TaxID=1930276 RepID=A0A517MQ92_9BACT|nr:RNA polymerase-associated protein RapA [Adhaeretor mobilis]